VHGEGVHRAGKGGGVPARSRRGGGFPTVILGQEARREGEGAAQALGGGGRVRGKILTGRAPTAF
jgi:hypothetical protein